MNHLFLLFAQQAPPAPWFLFPLLGVIGLIVIGAGVYGIRNERALLPARQKILLRLFGVDAVTGKPAVVIGAGQCLAGTGLLVAAVTGPFWAGKLADKPAGVAANAEREVRDEKAALRAGHAMGDAFEDSAPEGGFLVGLRCLQGKNYGGAIQAVQPIYQVGSGYALGAQHGPSTAGGAEHQLIAKPGYAVGALNFRSGLVLDALQLVFYRLDGKKLNADDRYESEWIGAEGGGERTVNAAGRPIIGVFGTSQDALVSLGLTPTKQMSRRMAKVTEPPPDLWSEPRPGAILGHGPQPNFSALAPDGGLLVGLRGFCDGRDYMALRGVQPIYLVNGEYREGDRCGDGGEFEILTLAKPGFCVGGISSAHVGTSLTVRLHYVRLSPQGPTNEGKYYSPWIGYPIERQQEEAISGPLFPVGITGCYDSAITRIGLMLRSPTKVRLAKNAALPAEYRQAAFAGLPLRAGSPQGLAFRDAAPGDGLLVGFRFYKGTNWGGAIQAMQPIYQVGTDYVYGRRYGSEGGQEIEVRAQPGYAVGALDARAGIALNAVQLHFYRIQGTRLNANDRQSSEWIGADGGGPNHLDAAGNPIAGVFGSYHKDLISLGLQPIQELAAPVPMPVAKEEVDPPFRKWTSADGKFSVEARLISVEGDTVKLQRPDGSHVTITSSKLSAADNAFLSSRAAP